MAWTMAYIKRIKAKNKRSDLLSCFRSLCTLFQNKFLTPSATLVVRIFSTKYIVFEFIPLIIGRFKTLVIARRQLSDRPAGSY